MAYLQVHFCCSVQNVILRSQEWEEGGQLVAVAVDLLRADGLDQEGGSCSDGFNAYFVKESTEWVNGVDVEVRVEADFYGANLL